MKFIAPKKSPKLLIYLHKGYQMAKILSLKKDSIVLPPSEYVENVTNGIITPICPIKYCYLAKPFYYTGSHVPRYSITLIFDQKKAEDRYFLAELEKYATQLGVTTVGVLDNGQISIKFQNKEPPELFMKMEDGLLEEIILESDLPEGYKASVEFDLNTFFNRGLQKKAFNYSPKKVIFHLDENSNVNIGEQKKDGNHKSDGDRSGIKNNRVRSSKLQSGKKSGVGEPLRNRKNPPKVKGS